jgi:hydroxyacylglutathione hydrolase
MVIQVFESGPFATNAYVIYSATSKVAAIIDPAPGSADSILAYIKDKNLSVSKILLTHSHFDHIADVFPLKQVLKIPVYIHFEDKKNLENPGSDGIPLFLCSFQAVTPDVLVKEGDIIEVGELVFEVIHTPGHTPGGVCYYLRKEGILFSGDTLFKRSIGNLSLPTAEPERMWPSLDKLAKLPIETKVYPGHGKDTTILAESWLSRARELFT